MTTNHGMVEGFIHRRGRKFFLALWISTLATITAMLGIGAMQAQPSVAPFISGVLTALSAVYATAVIAFNGSDALISRAAMAAGIEGAGGSGGPASRPSASVPSPGDAP